MRDAEHSLWSRRYTILWSVLAAAALTILASVVVTHDRQTLLRWSVFLSTNPQEGGVIFREKGCIHCHSVNGVGGRAGPDLGGAGGHPADLAFLVTAMWNHAPNMWGRMQAERLSYPTLTYEETAHLATYLYMASHMDGQGNAQQGKRLFTSKECIRCHGITNNKGGQRPLWVALGAAATPTAWTESIWNDAPSMENAMQKAGLAWPKLDAADLNDLFAYIRQSGGHCAAGTQQFPGDPEKGWRVFQAKSCIGCHKLEDDTGLHAGLQPENWLAPTFSAVGESMWNHVPEMQRAMQNQGLSYPHLSEEEMTDLIAFVYSLRYFDPPGSPVVGRSIFSWRECNLCHGEEAQGTNLAPALRGLGKNYNSISLATALWNHGQKMYSRTQKSSLDWPTLRPKDIGDLLAFLNSPMAEPRPQQQTRSSASRFKRKEASSGNE